jgi:nicotinamide riboside kinase
MRMISARLFLCAFAWWQPLFLSKTRPGFAILAIVYFATGPSLIAAEAISDSKPSEVLAWIRSAEKSGRLEVDFYPPDKRPTQFAGWTDFELTLEYKYDQQMKWKIARDKTVNVIIYPSFTTIKPLMSHNVKLPESLDASTWYESTLGRHELDHIAIGSHPRVILLATHLVKNIVTIKRQADRITDVNQKWAQDEITKEVNNRSQALQSLVTDNNKRLDELTRHGAREIDDRARFFDRLFLKENLDESKFAYLGDSLKLIESEEYRNATIQFPH